MARWSTRILPLLLAALLCAGCAGGAGGSGWLGIPSACKCVAEWVNEGTNWVLNKNQVSIVKVGEVRLRSDTASFVADFKIGVTNGTNSFETVAKDVPC